ncbi:MAG TPA: FixH family protein [Pyrinomonadaceae bacterium]|nr:FixH family protein [Pyrinomonadaceae bacterium]
MSKSILAFSLLVLLVFVAACGSKTSSVDTGKVIKSAPIGNLTVTLSSPSGQIKHGADEFFITFKDSSNKPVDVGAAALTFHMPQMASMPVMNDPATLTTTDTPGVYRAKSNIEMAGEWQAQVSFEGPAGKGQTSFSVTAQ